MIEFTGAWRSTKVRVLLTLPLVLLSATACGSKDSGGTASAVSAPTVVASAASSSAAATAGGTYKIPAKPCDAIDATALKPLAGRPVSKQPGKTSKNSVLSTTNCSVTFKAHLLQAEIDFVDPAGVLSQYEGLRKAQEASAKTTDISGVGQGAYSYVDPATGPNVVTYDGNLYLSFNLGSISLGGGQPGAEAIAPLTEITKATMAKLQS
jgi:hypothetical protein